MEARIAEWKTCMATWHSHICSCNDLLKHFQEEPCHTATGADRHSEATGGGAGRDVEELLAAAEAFADGQLSGEDGFESARSVVAAPKQ